MAKSKKRFTDPELAKMESDIEKDFNTYLAICEIISTQENLYPNVDKSIIFQHVLKTYNIDPSWLLAMQDKHLESLVTRDRISTRGPQ